MQEASLIHAIWDGALRSADSSEARSFKALVRALVPVPFSIFEVDGWMGQPAVLMDDAELIPGFSLGDVMAEELDADVPLGSLVIVRGAEPCADLSHSVGTTVGNILLAMIERAVYPLSSEDQALYQIGLAYHDGAETDELLALGLDPRAFRAGLTLALGKYWSMDEAPSLALFSGRAKASRLPEQLRDIERKLGDIRGECVALTSALQVDGLLNFNHWVLRLKALVESQLVRASRSLPNGSVGIA